MTRYPCRVFRAADVKADKLVICPLDDARLTRELGKEAWYSLHRKPAVGLRSDASHRYLFGVVYRTIADETGNDPWTIHLALKAWAVREGILEPIYDVVLGQLVPTEDITTKVDQDTFLRYTGWIRHKAEHGDFGPTFHIPEPNE